MLILTNLFQKFYRFLKRRISLSCLQDPATGPYLEPDTFSENGPILFLQHSFNLVLISAAGYSEWSLSLTFLDYNLECIFTFLVTVDGIWIDN
jgi:hypothetical protein